MNEIENIGAEIQIVIDFFYLKSNYYLKKRSDSI